MEPPHRVVEYYDFFSGHGPYYAIVSAGEFVPPPGPDGKVRHTFAAMRQTRRAAETWIEKNTPR
ncbi:hypothetical protein PAPPERLAPAPP_01570 [Brevundimonas phage vB_BpoS-Papperlapapp]|nr:hypothetical protein PAPPERLAPAPP_01570 [Brevundimonas phage vB_BpoS-Papperlapapp]